MLYVLLTASNLIFLICGYKFGRSKNSSDLLRHTDKPAVSATLSNIKSMFHSDEEAVVPVEVGEDNV